MPSELDLRLEKATAELTSADGPMPLTTFRQHGVDLPMIAAAPPALTHYFAHFCAQHGDTTFLVDGEERLSFAQTYAAARKVAGALIDGYGVKRGDRIGIAMRNAPSWVVLYMAILMAGGCATLLNGWWQGPELAAGIDDVEATIVFVDAPRAKRLEEVRYKGNARIVTLDIAQPIDQAVAPLLASGGGADTPLPEITGDDLATILFTSGSTGQSKGAFSTHRAVIQGTFNYIVQALVMLRLATEDGTIGPDRPPHASLLTVPLFHVTGEVPIMLVSFAIGRKIVMMPKWNAVTAMELIQREKITNFTGVPLMSFELLTHPDRHKYDLSSLQGLAGGGAPRPVDHVRRLVEEFPTAPPALGYGLTETNAIGAGIFSTNYLEKPNSTGAPSKPLVDLAILDDAGKSVPQGERGEVSIRSVALFSGYWNRPDATADCMTSDGYFRTGDIGYLDADNYLFIVDRKKDIIIRGGENISCQEVEAEIYKHPAVAEACVFGLPDERLGEVVGAVVYCHPGQSVTADDLTTFLGSQLAAFKVPQQVWISSEPLPRLGTEKIDKVSLRKDYREIWAKSRG
ncbi:class I adenylate-forming enzyme family protein [Aquisediminimonas profunda]|uniref:class I adenylate-forming enzyme family protein n=1 Tax=Aquisediminimonas profunda TaxID=1550733 RepID=UPI001C62825A|nr:class I adenylate-forming enzyme family protein [Aquisediminimonas profunda]